jgi:hypothetical protein
MKEEMPKIIAKVWLVFILCLFIGILIFLASMIGPVFLGVCGIILGVYLVAYTTAWAIDKIR